MEHRWQIDMRCACVNVIIGYEMDTNWIVMGYKWDTDWIQI